MSARGLIWATGIGVIVVAVAFYFLVVQSTAPYLGSSSASDQLVVRLPSFSLVLDPRRLADTESRKVASAMHAGLVAVDAAGVVHPMAAKSWKELEAGTWEFELDPKIQFSDGRPVEAEDVISSICSGMQPKSAWAFSLASIVHETSADGKSVICSGLENKSGRVLVRQTKPSPWLLDALGQPGAWILPRNLPTEAQPYGVVPGIGPYTFESAVPDESIVLKARSSGAGAAPTARLVFRYIQDSALAAQAFNAGKLDVLDADAPGMLRILFKDQTASNAGLVAKGHVELADSDRVRVVIINEKRLSEKGFSADQIRAFREAYSSRVDRQRLASLSNGLAEPLVSPTPVRDFGVAPAGARSDAVTPAVELLLITESDPFSDQIAAFLPSEVGSARIKYQGFEKGALIGRLLSGDYDLAATVLEGTMQAPTFWASFFTPGSAFTAFGKPIDGLASLDLTTSAGRSEAGRQIHEKGNWVGLLKERRVVLLSQRVRALSLTPSGQANFSMLR